MSAQTSIHYSINWR